jgi:hypothetical protein
LCSSYIKTPKRSPKAHIIFQPRQLTSEPLL